MNGLICDGCGEVLALDLPSGREDSNGERAAWIEIRAGGLSVDACTRSCATELLADGSTLARVIDAYTESIAEIARTIKDERQGDDDEPTTEDGEQP
ncbi:hypothetical protein [uncultured Jatrophihabitans sp.]|uniref:hypothetical protein n=1 Tax=uncultured Jatrophihabitans sp. TaxID=1610747 RepID=UPI0035CC43C3